MGSVKIDVEKDERRFDADYDLSSPEGVYRFLSSWPALCAEAAKANFAVVDAIVDLIAAFGDAGLTPGERDVAELVYFDGWDIDEAAGIANIDAETVRARLARVCEKVANYLGESEGYRGKA
jgi:DNA-directed RNA polymerase specialized sigma24 family protein